MSKQPPITYSLSVSKKPETVDSTALLVKNSEPFSSKRTSTNSNGFRQSSSASSAQRNKEKVAFPDVIESKSHSNARNSNTDNMNASQQSSEMCFNASTSRSVMAPEVPKSLHFKDLFDSMQKEKSKTQTNTFLSMKEELMAEKKQRVRREISEMNLSPEESEYYVEAFCIFDLDGSGTIDIEELGEVMKSLGLEVTEAELRGMMSRIKLGEVEEITVVEFVQLMASMRTQGGVVETGRDMIQAYGLMDVDNDGLISPHDLMHAFECVGEKISLEQAQDMIRVADHDLDGTCDFSDFERILTATFA